jgi:hypothetical protein
MKEWWQIVVAIAAVIGAISEIYLRLVPSLRKNKKKKKEIQQKIMVQLDLLSLSIEDFSWDGIGSIEESYKDANISKKLRKKLDELVSLASDYYHWRDECYQIINTEVKAQSKVYPVLDEASSTIFRCNFEQLLNGTQGSRSEKIYRAIFQGKLTFDIVKETLLKDNWEREVIIHNESGGVNKIMFKVLVDGEIFHHFYNEFAKLQWRKSIRTFKEIQEKLLKNSQLILKENFHATNTS